MKNLLIAVVSVLFISITGCDNKENRPVDTWTLQVEDVGDGSMLLDPGDMVDFATVHLPDASYQMSGSWIYVSSTRAWLSLSGEGTHLSGFYDLETNLLTGTMVLNGRRHEVTARWMR